MGLLREKNCNAYLAEYTYTIQDKSPIKSKTSDVSIITGWVTFTKDKTIGSWSPIQTPRMETATTAGGHDTNIGSDSVIPYLNMRYDIIIRHYQLYITMNN